MRTGYLVTPDGLTLKTYCVDDTSPSHGVAFLTHSQAQHSTNLLGTAEGLAKRGWKVRMADLRGHGHSSGPRAKLGHMEMNGGWESLVSDLRLALEDAFDQTDWADRLVVAPNIGAGLVLEILKDWPDLARNIVFCSPPPNQPKLMGLGRAFTKARSIFNAPDQEDALTQHQLYRFLGLHLESQSRLIDVMTSDQEITDRLLADPLAWPTPTTGYFHEMFRGLASAWMWTPDCKVRPGTRVLILYGAEDPVTARGSFISEMTEHLLAIGCESIDSVRVDGGRAGLVIDESRLGISRRIHDWSLGSPATQPKTLSSGSGLSQLSELSTVSYQILSQTDGYEGGKLRPEDLVELCYNAVNDDRHWAEMFYHLAYEVSTSTEFGDRELQATLDQLMPHWERSYAISQQVMQNAVIGSVLQDVINRFGLGMVIVNDKGDILQANVAFDRLMDADHEDEAGLTRRRLSRLVQEQVDRLASETLIVDRGRSVGFYFRPPVLRQVALRKGGGSGVVIVTDARRQCGDSEESDNLELLRLAYGFTRKEADVVQALLSGHPQDDCASRLDISINTLKTHLRSIFEKTGVRSQAELISRLLSGPFGILYSP